MLNLNNPSESMKKAHERMALMPEAIEKAKQSMLQIQEREIIMAQKLEKKLFNPSEVTRH